MHSPPFHLLTKHLCKQQWDTRGAQSPNAARLQLLTAECVRGSSATPRPPALTFGTSR